VLVALVTGYGFIPGFIQYSDSIRDVCILKIKYLVRFSISNQMNTNYFLLPPLDLFDEYLMSGVPSFFVGPGDEYFDELGE
jgi:hypothetical protein